MFLLYFNVSYHFFSKHSTIFPLSLMIYASFFQKKNFILDSTYPMKHWANFIYDVYY